MGEVRKLFKISVEKPEGKSPFRRPRRRWQDGWEQNESWGGWLGEMWSGFCWLRIGINDGLL
jgi:hypothetical protein